MSIEPSTVAMIVAVTFFAIGFFGSFVPIMPGTGFVWFGILAHRLIAGEASISWTFFWVATVLAATAVILDNLLTYWGARRFGASWQGALGGVAGGIAGLILFNLPGLILGPIIGVIGVEWYRNRNIRQAGRAGFGAILGGLLSFIGKFLLSCILIAGFFFSLAGWF